MREARAMPTPLGCHSRTRGAGLGDVRYASAAARSDELTIRKIDPAASEKTENRRIRVAHLAVDQVTRIRTARVGRRSNGRRKSYSRSNCKSCTIERGAPVYLSRGIASGAYLQLRNNDGDRRARIRREHRGGRARYGRHVRRLDWRGCRILVGNASQGKSCRSHFHVNGNRSSSIKRCQQQDHQDRQNHPKFDRRDAARRCNKTAIHADRPRHDQ